MDYHRAEEILHSTGVIDVTYKGTSIWLKDLHKEENTAEIESLTDDYEAMIVPIDQLEES